MLQSPTPTNRTRAALGIAVLTVGWLAGSAASAYVTLSSMSSGQTSEGARVAGLVVTAAVVVLAPLGIAAVARSRDLFRTACAYAILSALLFAGTAILLAMSTS